MHLQRRVTRAVETAVIEGEIQMKRSVKARALFLFSFFIALIPTHAEETDGKGLWLSAGQGAKNTRF